MRRASPLAAALALAAASACAPAVTPDYAEYRARLPRSILVIPPLNQTSDVNAPYVYLSTVTRPLAESGYYVFPVATVDAFLKENGLPTPGEMHGASLAKIQEVFGADGVLYVTLEDWGQKYRIVSSDTVVSGTARLVDVRSGATLWEGRLQAQQSSSSVQTDPIAMLISALVAQVVASVADNTPDLARVANEQLFLDGNRGLLPGPYHPASATDPRGR